MTLPGKLHSVNVAQPETIQIGSRTRQTGIFKRPVAGRIPVKGESLEGDVQVDRRFHGGHDKAVYAYASEDYLWWSTELGRELKPGTFGENLTTVGVDVNGSVIGERWRVGTS